MHELAEYLVNMYPCFVTYDSRKIKDRFQKVAAFAIFLLIQFLLRLLFFIISVLTKNKPYIWFDSS